MEISAAVQEHYSRAGLLDLIKRSQSGEDESARRAREELSRMDEFHTGGNKFTQVMFGLGSIQHGSKVLDIGCGFGGTSRFVASTFGCHVHGLDLNPDFVEAGKILNRWARMEGQVELIQGSALLLPYEDGSFDVAYTQHAQMNIEDKQTFYKEASRVLKPGGTFFFNDVFRLRDGDLGFPLPWADTPPLSFLEHADKAKSMMESAGLRSKTYRQLIEETKAGVAKGLALIDNPDSPAAKLKILLGDDAKLKFFNYSKACSDGLITVCIGTATKAS